MFVKMLPARLREPVQKLIDTDELIEVRFHADRVPRALLTSRSYVDLDSAVVQQKEVDALAKELDFDSSNRATIPNCLHRFSRITNRKGHVIGIACAYRTFLMGVLQKKVGEYVTKVVQRHGQSVLIIAPPGYGKSTMLTACAYLLGDVFKDGAAVIDSSLELGGSGDVQHYSLGDALRYQVVNPDRQEAKMLEVVANHRPQVILVDEIRDKSQAEAALNIKSRGVPLVATVHARDITEIINNTALNVLTGKLKSAAIGDDRAYGPKGLQRKIVVEREQKPVFDQAIVLIDFHLALVYDNVAEAVDAYHQGPEKFAALKVLALTDGTVTREIKDEKQKRGNFDDNLGIKTA